MVGFVKRLLYLIGDEKKTLVPLTLAFTIPAFLEVLGIGLIAPFLQLAANPDLTRHPEFLQKIYSALGINSENAVLNLGVLIIILFFIKSILYLLSRYFFYYFVSMQRSKIIRRLLHAYLQAPYTFHLDKNSTLLIQNIVAGSSVYVFGFMYPILDTAVNLILASTMLTLMISTNVLLLTMILGLLFPVIFVFFNLREKIRDWGSQERRLSDGIAKIISHALGGIKEVKIIGCDGYFLNQMDEVTKGFNRSSTLSSTTSEVPKILIEAILASAIIGFVIISGVVLKRDMSTVTSVMGVFAVASIRLMPAIVSIFKNYSSLQSSSYSINVIYEDLFRIESTLGSQLNSHKFKKAKNVQHRASSDHSPMGAGARVEVADARSERKTSTNLDSAIAQFQSSLRLVDISYRYPNSQDLAIDNLNLELKKGQSIAFIGKSGAGKTTLVDLLLGLLQPTSGRIEIDDKPVDQNFKSWQNLLGYIPQSIFLMDDTFIHNVAFGVPDAQIDYDHLHWSIQAAQLLELVDQLPDGLYTELGERGLRLSGGQRQRIGIARALYHQREILVLDEATSALDNETESLITESLKSLSGLKTMIVIAHRLSTIEHCDYVYVLEKGRIIRSGTYREVVTHV